MEIGTDIAAYPRVGVNTDLLGNELEIFSYLANIQCLGCAEDKDPLGIIWSVDKNSRLFVNKPATLHNNLILLPLFLQNSKHI